MHKSLSLFWFFFSFSLVAAASLLMVGLAGAQTIDFDPEERLNEDAPTLDPFVVYELSLIHI